MLHCNMMPAWPRISFVLMFVATATAVANTGSELVQDADDYSPASNEIRAQDPAIVPAEAFYVNGRRPPGSLLVNMLIKNEADHLDRTLPLWAKIVDAWIIGIDDNNTDNSAEIIEKHLGHVPGALVTVHFDGMGPTWSILVQEGYKRFPNITHGMLADADFAPMVSSFDKMELDIRCSKHLYNIYSADHTNKRKLDWIYRNTPAAKVERRTHQALDVPPLPGQDVFITELSTLYVDEHPGGYQDRTGGAKGKAQRYIKFLEDDLAEFGENDTRSLYYLGVGYLDLFTAGYNEAGGKPAPDDLEALQKSAHFYKRRAAIPGTEQGPKEERWFAIIKLGEIHERYFGKREKGLRYYLQAARLDPDRADAWFYAGQTLRLQGEPLKALSFLYTAASLPQPDRALFHWRTMYTCLAKLEYARAVAAINLDTSSFDPLMPSLSRRKRRHAGLAVSPGGLRAVHDTDASVIAAVSLPIGTYKTLMENVPKLSLPYLDAAVEFAQQAAMNCHSDGEHALAQEAEQLLVTLKAVAKNAQQLHQKAVQHAMPAAPEKAQKPSAVNSPTASPTAYIEVEYKGPRATPDVSISVKLRSAIPAVLPAVSEACASSGESAGVDGIPMRYHWCQLHTDLSALLAQSDAILCRDVRLLLRSEFRRSTGTYAPAVLEASAALRALFRHCS